MNLSNEILNVGLMMAMEFGANWLLSIEGRLLVKYPDLTLSEAKVYDDICQKVMKVGNAYVYKNPVKLEGKVTFIDSVDFAVFMRGKYVWIDDTCMGRLYSQGCYYALK